MFGENIQQLRKERRLSQEEVAQRLHISRQAVAKWETGGVYPDLDNLISLSNLFGVTIDAMLKSSDCISNSFEQKGVNYDRVREFLCKAKKNTYAAKAKEELVSSRPNSHDLIFSENNMKYIDSYLGGEKFSGEEGIWMEDTPVWAMNYTGRVLNEEFSGDFLNEALLLIPIEKPFRGPSVYQKGKFTYHSMTDGDFDWFQGREEILYEGLLVYECFFHGGMVR